MNQTFMKERKILPLILSMALPMVISMAVNSLYNIVDSYFVAKISDEAMTALSLVFPIQNMINAIAIGFGVGVNASIAYFLGAEKQEDADTSASFGVLLSLIHGILLTIICILIMPAFLRMFTSDADILDLALTYSRRVFLFSVFVNVGICYEKLFQAVGKMKVSMFSMILRLCYQYYPGSAYDLRNRSFSGHGYPGCRLCHRHWPVSDPFNLSYYPGIAPDPGSCTSKISEMETVSDRPFISGRNPSHPEYRSAFRSGFRIKSDSDRIFRTIRTDSRYLL